MTAPDPTPPPPRTLRLSWPAVIVVALVLAAIVILAIDGKDTATLVAMGMAILGGIGLVAGQQFVIKDQTNGHQSQLLATVREMAAQLAQMHPPPPAAEQSPPPAAETDT